MSDACYVKWFSWMMLMPFYLFYILSNVLLCIVISYFHTTHVPLPLMNKWSFVTLLIIMIHSRMSCIFISFYVSLYYVSLTFKLCHQKFIRYVPQWGKHAYSHMFNFVIHIMMCLLVILLNIFTWLNFISLFAFMTVSCIM